jgi:carbonic anhydrase
MQTHSDKIATVIMCIDYRFWPHVLPILEKQYGDFDLIEVAGAAKGLASPKTPSERIVLLSNIKTSIALHHTTSIILTAHQDCGAYGGSGQFISLGEEMRFHQRELGKARDYIRKHFPGHKVETIFISRDNKGTISLIPIKNYE